MVRAIVNTAPGQLEWRHWPLPQPGKGQVRIRVTACGICATDLEMIAGWQRTGFPAIPGHEWTGIVDALGPGVDKALAGRRCVAENVLADGGEVGFEHPGGYAQYLLTEADKIYPLPDHFPFSSAALIEPLAVCIRGLTRLRPQESGATLIFGDGPIGLITLALLKLHNVGHVLLVGGRPARLKLAADFGADMAWNYHELGGNLAAAIHQLNGGAFAQIIEASGSAVSLAASLDVVRAGGKILLLGDYGSARAGFPWNRILHRELEIIGSNASAGAWPEAVRLATSGAVPLPRLISQCVPASDFRDAMEQVRYNREMIKVILDWTRCPETEPALGLAGLSRNQVYSLRSARRRSSLGRVP
jgi:threonine dehydrogenase-like Zn-dependent dehydrogenase